MPGRWDGMWRSAQLLRLSLGVAALSGTVVAALVWTTSTSASRGRKSIPKSEEEEDEELEEETRGDAPAAQMYECELQPSIEEDQPATADLPSSTTLPKAAASVSTPRAAAAVASHSSVAPWTAPAFSPFASPWAASQGAATPGASSWGSGVGCGYGASGAGVPRRHQAAMSPGEKRDLDLMFRHQERQEGRTPMIPDLTKARQRARLSVRRREAPTLAALVDEATVNQACSSTSSSREVAAAVADESVQHDVAAMDELLLAELGELDPAPSRSKKGRRRPKKKSKAGVEAREEVDAAAVDETDVLPVTNNVNASDFVSGAEGAEGAECSFVGVTDGVNQHVKDAVTLGSQVRENTEVGSGTLQVGPRWMRMRLGPLPLEEEEEENMAEEAEGEADAEADTGVDADIEADVEVKAEPCLALAAAARSASQAAAATAAATAAAAAAALQAPGRLPEEQECHTEDSSVEEAPQPADRQKIAKATGASAAGQALTPTTDGPSSRQCSEAGDESGHVPFEAPVSSGSGDPSSYRDGGLGSPERRRHRAWADLTDSSEDEFFGGYIPPQPSPVVAALLYQAGRFRYEGPARSADDEKRLSPSPMCSARGEVRACEEGAARPVGTTSSPSASVEAPHIPSPRPQAAKAKARVAKDSTLAASPATPVPRLNLSKAQPQKQPKSSRRSLVASPSKCVANSPLSSGPSVDKPQANAKADGDWIEVSSRRHNRPSRAAA